MLPDGDAATAPDVGALNEFLHLCPLHQWLGCFITAYDPRTSSLEVHLPDRPELHRSADGPVAHGGVVAALVDIAAHAALHASTGHGIPTIDMRIDYLRLAALPLTARARVVRKGRTIGSADVDIIDCDGRMAAQGRAVFLTLSPQKKA